MEKFIESAYNQIETIYNNGRGGDKFISHLIRAFLPINEWERYIDTDKKCCITGKLGFSVTKFTQMTTKSIFLRAKIEIGNEEEKAIAQKEYDEIREAVRKEWNAEEGENIMKTRQTFYSEKSDKVLCTPAIIALRDFASNQLLRGDQKMNYVLKSQMFSQVEGVSEKEAQIAAKKDSGFKLSGFEVDAFKDLAERFKNKQ